MKKNLSDYLVASGVIVCSLILLAALAMALAGWRPQKRGRMLQIDYPDVTGIREHSQLRYAGVPAGSVVALRVLTDAERRASNGAAVRVSVQLFDDVPPVPADVRASLASDTLLSEKFVALSAGSPDQPKLADGAVLRGGGGGSIDGLIESIGPLLQQLPKTLENIDAVLTKTGGAVETLEKGFGEVLPRISVLAEELKGTSAAATEAIARIDQLVDDVDEPLQANLKKLRETLGVMQGTLGTAEKLFNNTDKTVQARMAELSVVLQNLKVATTYAKAAFKTVGERPNRLIFGGKENPLPSESEILKERAPVPATRASPQNSRARSGRRGNPPPR